MDKLRAGHSLSCYESKKTEIDERGCVLFPGLIDDTLLPMQLLNSLLQDCRNHDMKEFLHWFEIDFEMKNIASGLEQRNASWMPICNSGDKASDDNESRKGKGRFPATTFEMAWGLYFHRETHHEFACVQRSIVALEISQRPFA